MNIMSIQVWTHYYYSIINLLPSYTLVFSSHFLLIMSFSKGCLIVLSTTIVPILAIVSIRKMIIGLRRLDTSFDSTHISKPSRFRRCIGKKKEKGLYANVIVLKLIDACL